MDLNDAEAQELLLRALPVDEKESHLVAKKTEDTILSVVIMVTVIMVIGIILCQKKIVGLQMA